MEWEKFTDLVKLYNNSEYEAGRKFFLQNIEDAEYRDVEAILIMETITPENVRNNIDFFDKYVEKAETFAPDFKIGSAVRFEYLKNTMRDERNKERIT